MGAIPSPTPTVSPALPSVPGRPARKDEIPEAVVGMIFAGYGAYIYALQLLVSRINVGSVTGRFMARLALQSAVALLMGAVAGQTRTALAIGSPNQALFFYFLLGLFPGWARLAIRKRARGVLTPDEVGCESLPLCMVDGVDEDVTDRLWEQGMDDIQHLATADPVALMLRTSYSPRRILDWIDQAILIGYVRAKIPAFRSLGVRGAIDLARLCAKAYAPPATAGAPPSTAAAPAPSAAAGTAPSDQADAAAALTSLAIKTEFERSALSRIGVALLEDDQVHFVWLLRQNRPPW